MTYLVNKGEEWDAREWGGKERDITFSLSGTSDRAPGRRDARMFWMMVEAAATPQTVPMERKR